jgi:hypothetical protein
MPLIFIVYIPNAAQLDQEDALEQVSQSDEEQEIHTLRTETRHQEDLVI